jgi:hypothetical protein
MKTRSSPRVRFLQTVGATYPMLGVALGLVFATQGAENVIRPFLAGTFRLVVIVAGLAIVVRSDALGTPHNVFLVVAGSTILYALGQWAVSRPRRPRQATAPVPARAG